MLSMLIENLIKLCRQIVQVFRIERCDKHFLKTLKHFFQCFVALDFQVFDLFTALPTFPPGQPTNSTTQLLDAAVVFACQTLRKNYCRVEETA